MFEASIKPAPGVQLNHRTRNILPDDSTSQAKILASFQNVSD
jgi:hypothetical protein